MLESIPAGYSIQLAKPEHIPLLAEIEAAAGTIFPDGSLPENVLAERVPYTVFADACTDGRLLVALDSARSPVGFAFWLDIVGSALLALIEVHPHHGQKRLGSAMVARVIQHVTDAGFSSLYLTTFADIPWNQPFYQKSGFVTLDDEKQPAFITEILREERAKGLSNRVSMRYSLA